LTALLTTLVFFVDVPVVAAAQMLLFIALCRAAKVPFKKIFPHAKLLLCLIALVVALQVLFGQGLFTGLMIGCRLIALTVLLPLLALTTEPGRLALGITRMGANYRAAFIITSTLNLIPSFEEEARQIIDARKLRGMKSVKLKEYPAIALPLMIKAMRQAHTMALAMDTRAFGAYKTRTWLREIRFTPFDYMALAAGIAYTVLMLAANCLLSR
jgi:energy-coupling factor transport system permease protein